MPAIYKATHIETGTFVLSTTSSIAKAGQSFANKKTAARKKNNSKFAQFLANHPVGWKLVVKSFDNDEERNTAFSALVGKHYTSEHCLNTLRDNAVVVEEGDID